MKTFLLLLILLVITFVGCTPESQKYIVHPMNRLVTTYIGGDILIERWGYYRKYEYQQPFYTGNEYRLSFVGVLDNILDMTYREFHYEDGKSIIEDGHFMEEYKYDISESTELVFKDYVITLISYDGNSITYIITK